MNFEQIEKLKELLGTGPVKFFKYQNLNQQEEDDEQSHPTGSVLNPGQIGG
jgi:hypothetical protein